MRKWKRFKTAANIPRTGCTKKLTRRSDCATLRQTTRNPRARHETPQASLSMLKVKLMTVQLENDWTRIAYMEGIPGGNLVSLHSTWQHSSGLQNCIWTNHKHDHKHLIPASFPAKGPGRLGLIESTIGSLNRTMTPSTTANLQQDGWNSKTKAWVSLL